VRGSAQARAYLMLTLAMVSSFIYSSLFAIAYYYADAIFADAFSLIIFARAAARAVCAKE